MEKDILLDLKGFIEQDPDDEALLLLEGMKGDEAIGKLLTVGCELVHPESGEVLAETGDTFRLPNPVAEHIITVAKAYPYFYIIVENACHIVIADATMTA